MRCTTRLMVSFLVLVSFSFPVFSVIVPSTTPVPPLQWINITGYLTGPAAPPLKGASIGYDSTTRRLLVFGGESQGGFPQSTTYLLDLDTLTWVTPSPPPSLAHSPPARSYAISGSDLAGSYRLGHVVIGGKDSNGNGLSDAWEFDYVSQFWANVNISPGGPSPRWGASGGIDPRISFLPVTGFNNSFYLAGGNDGTSAYPLSDAWRLNISGTLSSNVLNSIFGSWEPIQVQPIQPKVDQAGTIVYQKVLSVGGCNATGQSGNACLQDDSYVINMATGGFIPPQPCTVPRLEPVLVPNMNGVSSTFLSQAFLLLGTYNTSLWQDNNGLERGEVAVLDVGAGTWSRVLPAGDPASTNPFPTPRSGAAAFSSSEALVGGSRTASSDILVFGGQDATGAYLSEVWILRTYLGSLASSTDQWSGFGNGQLQSGPNATGTGVNVTYLTTCASLISQPGSTASGSSPSSTSTTNPTSRFYSYNTSFVHKLLAPLSVAVFMPAILLYRMSSSYSDLVGQNRRIGLVYMSVLAAIAAYGIGIGGLAASFTSVSYTSPSFLTKRSSTSYYLKTAHGQAGLAFFIVFYGIIPFLAVSSVLFRYREHHPLTIREEHTEASINTDEREKLGQSPAPSDMPPSHVRNLSGFNLWSISRNRDARKSNESVRESLGSSTGPSRSFEVTNRPSRSRHPSGEDRSNRIPRSFGEMNWLDQRRRLNSAGELDYALSQINRGPGPATPNTVDVLSTNALMDASSSRELYPTFPPLFEGLFHILFNSFLIGLCVISLVELWNRASVATFAVFLVWTVLFYILLFILAWKGHPRESILAAVIFRLWLEPNHHSHLSSPSRPLSSTYPDSTVPADGRGPYVHHQPTFRAAVSGTEEEFHLPNTRQFDTEEDYDVEDEELQQRRIEEEMSRRDVSIVTVPRRKLWITNPSTRDVDS